MSQEILKEMYLITSQEIWGKGVFNTQPRTIESLKMNYMVRSVFFNEWLYIVMKSSKVVETKYAWITDKGEANSTSAAKSWQKLKFKMK